MATHGIPAVVRYVQQAVGDDTQAGTDRARERCLDNRSSMCKGLEAEGSSLGITISV